MIPAPDAVFAAEEARRVGAQPVLRHRFYPFCYDPGLGEGRGSYTNSHYRQYFGVQADVGAAAAEWVSEALATGQPQEVEVATEWREAGLGYVVSLQWRTAATAEGLAGAAWLDLSNGGTAGLLPYYQLRVTWSQIACYFTDDGAGGSEQLYFADGEPWSGWFVEGEGDEPTWVEAVALTGEYALEPEMVVGGGSLQLEAPLDYSDLVSGAYSVTLKDPEGRYDPLSDNFVWKKQPYWGEGLVLRLYLGYQRGAALSGLLLLYEGWVRRWGPHRTEVGPGGEVSRTLEIYTEDALALARRVPLGTPDEDGRPQPVVHGELLLEAEQAADEQPWEPTREADFETGDTTQLNGVVTANGGTFQALAAAAYRGGFGARAAAAAANAAAYGKLEAAAPSTEGFVALRLRVNARPAEPGDRTTRILGVYGASGDLFTLYVGSDGKLWLKWGGVWWETDGNLRLADGNWVRLAVGVKNGPANAGVLRVWLESRVILEKTDQNFSQVYPQGIWFGPRLTAAESWEMDFDEVEYHNYFYPCWFRVPGGPYQEITEVWVDNLLVPRERPRKSRRLWHLELAKNWLARAGRGVAAVNYATINERGAVIWSDYLNEPSGQMMVRVVRDAVSTPAEVLASLAAAGGLTVDATRLAELQAATAGETLGCRFESTTVAEALAELAAAALINIWLEQGTLRAAAGEAGTAVMVLTEADGWASEVVVDTKELVAAVLVKWGWYDRSKSYSYTAVNGELQARGYGLEQEELDLSWGNPVATDRADTAKAKAEALLARLGGRMEVRFSGRLHLARLELWDRVEWQGELWTVAGKTINFESRPWGVELTLVRWL